MLRSSTEVSACGGYPIRDRASACVSSCCENGVPFRDEDVVELLPVVYVLPTDVDMESLENGASLLLRLERALTARDY